MLIEFLYLFLVLPPLAYLPHGLTGCRPIEVLPPCGDLLDSLLLHEHAVVYPLNVFVLL